MSDAHKRREDAYSDRDRDDSHSRSDRDRDRRRRRSSNSGAGRNLEEHKQGSNFGTGHNKSQDEDKLDKLFEICQNTQNMLVKDVKEMQGKLHSHDSLLKNHEKLLAEHDTRWKEYDEAKKLHDESLERQIHEIQEVGKTYAQAAEAAAAVAAAAPRPSPSPSQASGSEDNFDRKSRADVVVANLEGLVLFQKEELEKSLKQIMSQTQINCKFEIPGPPVARRYSVIFSGPGWEESVQRLLRARKKDGAWERFEVKTPEGGSVKLFYGPDKSPKAVRLETISRKFAKYLPDTFPKHRDDEVKYFGRQDGMVLLNGNWLARIQVEPDNAKVAWNVPKLDASSVVKDAAVEYFKQNYTTQWSS